MGGLLCGDKPGKIPPVSKLSPKSVPKQSAKKEDERGVSPVAIAVVAGILIVGVAVTYKMFQPPPTAPGAIPVESAASQPAPQQTAPAASSETAPPSASGQPAASQPSAPAPAVKQAPPPPPDPKQSLAALLAVAPGAQLSPAQAQQWKQSLQDLINAGSASTPLIREILGKNQDVNFNSLQGGNSLGYPSLRSALIDALAQIGGADSLEALTQTLQTTPYPTDLVALSKALEGQGPQFQEQILGAARQQLSIAAQGQAPGTAVDVGPLFQLLNAQAANGVDVSADITQYAGKWPYYTAISLANLPNGSGMTGLIQMAQGAAGSMQNPAAEALAGMAADNPSARGALLEMAKNNQLPDSLVARMAPFLGGSQYAVGSSPPEGSSGFQSFHVADGNQDFVLYNPQAIAPDQVTQRINFIDQMLQNIGSGDAARQALQQQRSALMARLAPRR